MTPEFRKAIFSWNYDAAKDGEESLCIPLQLQRLFGLLQLSVNRSVDTVSLTRSFGWDSSEVFQQQDVQELTRVLFDALEESFRGNPMVENFIDGLYAGELIDYLRCIDVDYQSERKDKMLDLSLAIVPFGSSKAMHSLTECIETFLKPELLDGENQYFCEKFDKKVDAIKGLKFGRLPHLMSVQLKRFVYDFSGAYVVQKKLNDQVKFPMILNMNKYMAKKKLKKTNEETGEVETEEINNHEFEEFLQHQMEKLKLPESNNSPNPEAATATTIAGGAMEQQKTASDSLESDPSVPPLMEFNDTMNDYHVPEDGMNSPEKTVSFLPTTVTTRQKSHSIHVEPDQDVVYDSMTTEQVNQLVEEHGEWVYELYAVLIHSGAISGGHYYAYIKDFASGKWYNFNDSSVSLIDEKTVQETWGGAMKSYGGSSSYTPTSYYTPNYSSTSSSSSYQSSANAYMLMYRQVTEPVPTVPDEMIPSYIQDLVKEETKKREAKEKEEEEFRNRLNIRIHYEGFERTVPAKRTMTYEEFLQKMWEQLYLYKLPLTSVKRETTQEETHHNKATTTTATDGLNSPASEGTDTEKFSIEENSKAISAGGGTAAYHSGGIVTEDTKPPSLPLPETVIPTIQENGETTATIKEDIPPINHELFRLRDYNHYTKVVMGSIDFEKSRSKTLGDLNFSDYKVYYLETKTLHQEWDEFFQDGFSILIEEFDKDAFSFKEPKTIRLPQYASVHELKHKLVKFVNYPVEEMRIMKFVQVGFHDGKIEVFDNDLKRLKEDYYVYEGVKLYLERVPLAPPPPPPPVPPVNEEMKNASNNTNNNKNEAGEEDLSSPPPPPPPVTTPPQTLHHHYQNSTNNSYNSLYYSQNNIYPPVTSLAFETFLQLRNRIEVKFNNPSNPSSTCDETLMVDSRSKVQELREKVANALKIPVEKCRLFKLNLKGQELKDGDSSLTNNGIYNSITLAISTGKVTQAGYYPLSLSIFNALDNKVGVQFLPELEPETEEMETIEITNSKKEETDLYSTRSTDGSQSNTNNNNGIDENDVKPPEKALPQQTTQQYTGKQPGLHHYQPPTQQQHEASALYYENNEIDEGDNLSNKGIADDVSVSHDDQLDDPQFIHEYMGDYQDTLAQDDPEDKEGGGAYYGLGDVSEMELQHLNDRHNDQNNNDDAIVAVAEAIPEGEVVDFEKQHIVMAEAQPMLKGEPILIEEGTQTSSLKSNLNANNHQKPEEEVVKPLQDAKPPLTPTESSNNLNDSSNANSNSTQQKIHLGNVEPSDFAERMLKNSVASSQFQPLETTEICVQNSTPVEELRSMITEELVRLEKVPENTSPSTIRLRDRYSTNPGKFLRDGKTINESQIYLCDSKTLTIQILDHSEVLPENDHGDVIVMVQKWQRSSWTLGERLEVLLPGSWTVRDVGRGLAKLANIPAANLRVLVVPRDTVFYLFELNQRSPSRNYGRSWFDPTTERKLMRYMSHDMRVSEGDLIILQDIEEPLMELSPADLKSIEIVETANNMASSYSSSSYYGGSWNGNSSSSSTVMTGSNSNTYYPGVGNSTSVGTDYSRYGTSVSNTATASVTSSSRSQGIKIKTHKDRLKEQEQQQQQQLQQQASLAASNSNSSLASPAVGTPAGISSSTAASALLNGGQEEDLEDFQSIQRDIDEIDTSQAGKYCGLPLNGSGNNLMNPGNNSPTTNNPTTAGVPGEDLNFAPGSSSEELFRYMQDPKVHKEAKEFYDQGGWEQYDFLK
jgi:hypothetical protein